MKIALSWLSDYLGGATLDEDAVIGACASLGLPVEDVVHTGGVAGVITARVVRTERHPDAAKVIRVWVDTGDGVAMRRIVEERLVGGPADRGKVRCDADPGADRIQPGGHLDRQECVGPQ